MYRLDFPLVLNGGENANITGIIGGFSGYGNKPGSGGRLESYNKGIGDSTTQSRPSTRKDEMTSGQGKTYRGIEAGRSGTTQYMAFAYVCYAFAHEIETTLGGPIPYLQSNLSACLPTGLACMVANSSDFSFQSPEGVHPISRI